MATKNYEKMSVFEQMQDGLAESLAHVRGQLNLRTTTLPRPAPALSKSRVIAIRKKTGMSQAVFAGYLNVPTRTLQSWEQGARRPKAGEARLLQIFETAPRDCLTLVRRAATSSSAATTAPGAGKIGRPRRHADRRAPRATRR